MDVSSLAPRVRSILIGSDLATVSAKKVRRQLEAELNISLDSNKSEIDEIIMDQFHQIHNENQTRQAQLVQQQQQYAQQQQAHMTMYGVSPGMSNLHVQPGYTGLPAMHPHQAVSAAAMGVMGHAGAPGILPGAGNALQPDAAPRRRGRPRKPENEKKQHRKKREVDPNKPKRQTGLSKPMKLSEDLGEFLKQKYCARTDVVKNLWKYIKEHDLQDSSDKRYILCDDKLKKLFDTDRLYMYTMNKLLNQHLVKPTPEENAEAIVLLGLPPNHPANADSAGIVAAASSATTAAQPENTASPSATDNDSHADVASDGNPPQDSKTDPSAASQQPPAPTATADGAAPAAASKPEPAATPAMALPPQPSSVNGGGNA
ncbi:hypothetical protein EC988_003283, partial [Linderina pennispora]